MAKGAFVRICIGSKDDGGHVFRLARIEGFEKNQNPQHAAQGYKYNAQPEQQRKEVWTDKLLLLSIGQVRRAFMISMVSNEQVSVAEVAKYHETLAKSGDAYSLGDARDKKGQIERVRNHTYTKEDRQRLIAVRKEKRSRTSNIAKEVTRMEQQLLRARQLGDGGVANS